MELTADDPSPKLFRLWTAISMVGASLERRVWCKIARPKLYPNLYTLLVGPPGRGKTTPVILASQLIGATKKLHMAPSNVNSASLLDVWAKCKKSILINGLPEEYHSLYVASREFGHFLPEYDRAFLQVLTDVFDNPPDVSVQRISRGKDAFSILLPQLNILGATTPSFLSEMVPESAWSGGFCARFLLIYCHTSPQIELFKEVPENLALSQKIVTQLCALETRFGLMQWEEQAASCLKSWYIGKMPPRPSHPRLEHYCERRQLFATKLAMIKALSSRGEMVIRHEDMEWGIQVLIQAEAFMPDVFRAMAGRSDDAVIGEMHLFVSQLYNRQRMDGRGKRRSVPESMIYAFLRERLPSEKIKGVLELAQLSGVLAPGEDGLGFIPKPRVDLWRTEI